MRTNLARVRRLEALALKRPRRSFAPDAALLDSIIAKAERALAGDIGAPADWTNAPAALVAHRERLLEWVLKQD